MHPQFHPRLGMTPWKRRRNVNEGKTGAGGLIRTGMPPCQMHGRYDLLSSLQTNQNCCHVWECKIWAYVGTWWGHAKRGRVVRFGFVTHDGRFWCRCVSLGCATYGSTIMPVTKVGTCLRSLLARRSGMFHKRQSARKHDEQALTAMGKVVQC